MKQVKFRYIACLTALVALFTACEEEPATVLQPEADYATVSLSSLSSLIAADGGEKNLFVASNRTALEARCDADWVDVSLDGNTLTLYVDPNPDSSSRLAVVEVVAGLEPDLAKARYKLMQQGNELIDLSAEGMANCYIAPTNHTYRLRCDLRGNGKGDGNARYGARYGLKIEGGAYAELIWEATPDGDKTRSCRIIAGSPIYSAEEQVIAFSTGSSEGNALIALCDKAGEILWSWHIWVTDKPITTSQANGLEWMDRNLGALNNTPDDLNNRGLLYQWGRKEPFLPSAEPYIEVPTHSYDEEYNLTESEEEYNAIQAAIEAARLKLNIHNEQRGDGCCIWNFQGIAPVALNAPGNIHYALQHPTTILGCRTDIPIGEYLFDWYLQQDLEGQNGVMMQSDSHLWGDAEAGSDYKTIFDPCPVGYAVPPHGAFGEIPAEYACSYVNRAWSREATGWCWTGGNGDYFPSAGNLDVSGLMGETAERMLYWTAEEFGGGASGFGKAATLFVAYNEVYYGIYPLLDESIAASWYSYGARSTAASIRCVKETTNK